MTIVGKIIKQAIHLSDVISTEADPVKEQNQVLRKLLEKAEHTAFGKQILMLGSSTNLIQKDDYLEGEISGIRECFLAIHNKKAISYFINQRLPEMFRFKNKHLGFTNS